MYSPSIFQPRPLSYIRLYCFSFLGQRRKTWYPPPCLLEASRSPLITSAPLNTSQWDEYAKEGRQKRLSRFHYLGLKIKALLSGSGMQCRYADLNNSRWSKSSSEGDRYFYVLCFTWGRKMAPVYVIWMRAGAQGRKKHVQGCVRWKEKGDRKQVRE